MEDHELATTLTSMVRDQSKVACAEVLWSKCRQMVVSSAQQGWSISYHDMASGRSYDLCSVDTQQLAQDGLDGFRKSINELIDSQTVEFFRFLENNRRDAAQRLFKIMADEKGYDDEVKGLAGNLVIKKLTADAFDAVAAMLNVEDNYIRYQAVNLLSWIEDPRVIDPLIAALQDTDPDIRCKAVVGLGSLKVSSQRAVGPLVALLETEIPAGKRQVREAIERLDPKALERIEENRRTKAMDDRRQAGLCGFCGKRVGLLRRILNHTDHANCREYVGT